MNTFFCMELLVGGERCIDKAGLGQFTVIRVGPFQTTGVRHHLVPHGMVNFFT